MKNMLASFWLFFLVCCVEVIHADVSEGRKAAREAKSYFKQALHSIDHALRVERRRGKQAGAASLTEAIDFLKKAESRCGMANASVPISPAGLIGMRPYAPYYFLGLVFYKVDNCQEALRYIALAVQQEEGVCTMANPSYRDTLEPTEDLGRFLGNCSRAAGKPPLSCPAP